MRGKIIYFVQKLEKLIEFYGKLFHDFHDPKKNMTISSNLWSTLILSTLKKHPKLELLNR